MSTKIYDGLQATYSDPFALATQVRKTLQPLFIAEYKRAVAHARAHLGESWNDVFQLYALRKDERWLEPIVNGAFRLPERVWDMVIALQKSAEHTLVEWDFGYEVALLPDSRPGVDMPLMLVFSERDIYRSALLEAGVAVDYGYWNNTDGPEDVTAEEWEGREKAWDDLDVPAEQGLFIFQPSKFQTVYDTISMTAAPSAAPTAEEAPNA